MGSLAVHTLFSSRAHIWKVALSAIQTRPTPGSSSFSKKILRLNESVIWAASTHPPSDSIGGPGRSHLYEVTQ
jgi:hypothetical protein